MSHIRTLISHFPFGFEEFAKQAAKNSASLVQFMLEHGYAGRCQYDRNPGGRSYGQSHREGDNVIDNG
jgi:hypothetical protein